MPNQQHLHIVSLDVPFPVDYGGVFDLFYKIQTLHSLGVKIYLHCFTKDRKPQKELDKYCTSVNYYPRKKGLKHFSFTTPYFVKTRVSELLISNLKKDNYPILFEGIHCSNAIQKNIFDNRKLLLRLHNVEFEYYAHLAKYETNWIKKIYYWHETKLLKKYEKKIANKAMILTVSKHDKSIYEQTFGAKNIDYLPVFLPFTKVNTIAGKGLYCLYQGNLSIAENEKAVFWLMDDVLKNTTIPFVIAGKKPSKKFIEKINSNCNCKVIANPSETELENLILNAQIHLLPSFNNTGIKLKLLNALYNGRYCIVNNAGIIGTNLQSCCIIANSANEYLLKIKENINQPFTEEQINERKLILQHQFDNIQNGEKLITYLQ